MVMEGAIVLNSTQGRTNTTMMQDAAHTGRSRGAGLLRRFMADDRGDALAEYALVTAVLSIAMLATLHLISTQGGNKLNNTGNALTNQAYTP